MIFDADVDAYSGSIPPAKHLTGYRLDDLVFVGLNGRVAALHRDSGLEIWSNNQMKGGGGSYMSMLLDGDRLVVSSSGYIYCFDPLNGRILWHNPMKGYGSFAPTALASVRGFSHDHVAGIQAMAAASGAAAAAAS